MAVNRRQGKSQNQQNGEHSEADFFRVSAWNDLGANCQKYLTKGKKVCVVGPVSVNTYTAQDGSTRASLNVLAQDVEFLSPKDSGPAEAAQPEPAPGSSDDHLPF